MRTITTYLQLAGITGDAVAAATAAVQAALTDAQAEASSTRAEVSQAQAQVQTEIKESQFARALASSFRKVAEKAGIDLSALSDTSMSAERRRELSDDLGNKVLEFVGAASDSAQDAAGILKTAGFDLDAYQKAGKDRRGELAKVFTDGVTGSKAQLAAAERERVFTDLKLDPKKASTILGDVTLERGKVIGKDATGNPVEVETWGTKAADGSFIPVGQTLAEKGWTLAELAPKAADAGTGLNLPMPATAAPAADLSWILQGGQAAAPASGGADPLAFLNPPAPAAAPK